MSNMKSFLITIFACISISTNANSYRETVVQSLPGYGKITGKQTAGYLPTHLHDNKAGLFFWYVQHDHAQTNAPIIIWFNGGPGAASSYGFFMENGPFAMGPNGKPILRRESWNKVGDYMIIDQPAGVGYSYGEGTYHNEEEAMDQLAYAVSAYFQHHPEHAHKPLYLAGESYAGKYIPQLAVRLLKQRNDFMPKLTGLFIGDPWVNPSLQQSANIDYAYYHGLISQQARDEVRKLYHQCELEIKKSRPSSRLANSTCVKIQEFIQQESGGLNLANIQKGVEPSDEAMITYLNREDVRKTLDINPLCTRYSTFNDHVAKALEIGEQDSLADLYPSILAAGVKVLIFNGIEDGKDSNFLSSDLWLSALNWPGKSAFANAKTCVWHHQNNVYGYIRSAQGLTQAKVRGAGHLAPIDQPNSILDLLQRFINNTLPC